MFQFHQNNSQLLFHVIVSPWGAGAFSRGFTKILAWQCRAFSRALKIEKLKAPLFPGPGGAGDANDWCINNRRIDYSIFSHSWIKICLQNPGLEISSCPLARHGSNLVGCPQDNLKFSKKCLISSFLDELKYKFKAMTMGLYL